MEPGYAGDAYGCGNQSHLVTCKEISTFLSLSRWWVVLQKQNFTPAPRAGTAWAATSPSLLSTLSSSNHIRWTSVCKPSSNTSPSWVALLQKSLTRLRCHRGCDKNLSHEPAPGLSCTGPFLNCSDQNFSCQDSRRAAPHAATEQYIRGHSRRALHSYFPLNIFPGKHDKYVSEAAGTCQISISTPCCGLRKKKKKAIHCSAYLESLLYTEQTPPDVSIGDVIYKWTKQLVRLIAPGGI